MTERSRREARRGKPQSRPTQAKPACGIESLETRSLLSAFPFGDATLGTIGSTPRQMTDVGGVAYFIADTAGHPTLWKTDGTAGGTASIRPFNNEPSQLTAGGGLLFFRADGELWKSDGTLKGTARVKDINPSGDSNPLSLHYLNGVLYFIADNGAVGPELWRSDGTSAGTSRVRDIRPGAAGSGVTSLFDAGGLLYFAADDGSRGRELWRSDGTFNGTQLVADLEPGAAGSNPHSCTAVGGSLYFTTATSTGPFSPPSISLWRTTAAGAGAIRLIGPSFSELSDLTPVGGRLLFVRNGTELWTSDGSPAGTTALRTGLANVANLTPAGGLVYFTAADAAHGEELWATDGTAGGTALVSDITPGRDDSFPTPLLASNDGQLIFAAAGGVWSTGGTAANTVLLHAEVTPFAPFNAGGTLYFFVTTIADGQSNLHSGQFLWRSDGTAAGTGLVADVSPDFAPNVAQPFTLGLGFIGGVFYFSVDDGLHGAELWRGNASGATMVKDLNTTPRLLDAGNSALLNGRWYVDTALGLARGDADAKGLQLIAPGLHASHFATLGDAVIYSTAEQSGDLSQPSVWRIDPNSTSPTLLFSGAEVDTLLTIGDTLFFSVPWFSSITEATLWRTDGTRDGVTRVADIVPGSLQTVGGDLYFFGRDDAGANLWRWHDGAAGRAKAIVTGGEAFARSVDDRPILSSVELGGTLLFIARDAAGGAELWRSDGTDLGTHVVKDIRPGPADAITYAGPDGEESTLLMTMGGAAYFFADDGAGRAGLWKSDGTDAGTSFVASLGGGSGYRLSAATGRVYFIVRNGSSDALWTSDGTTAGTSPLATFAATSPDAAAAVGPITTSGGSAFFAAAGSTIQGGDELWRSDGTIGGTYRVADVQAGAVGSKPFNLTVDGGSIYFVADDGVHGRTLWWSRVAPAVLGRHIYYNNSVYDGNTPAVTAADAAAVAPDKRAALPGQAASFANVTSYTRGINGMVLDLAADITNWTLRFTAGRSGDPAAWPTALAPTSVVPQPQPDGTTRLFITWADGAIVDQWLQGTIDLFAGTTLVDTDVFRFGNLVGDAGAGAAISVSPADLVRTRNALGTSRVAIDSPFDFNRDGRIDAADLVFCAKRIGMTLPDWTATPSASVFVDAALKKAKAD